MFGKRDPVCGAKIKTPRYALKHAGRTYYFDCQACRATFEEDPQRFAGKGKKPGFFRWLSAGAGEIPKSCHEMKR